mgnify:CR=1 FL=1
MRLEAMAELSELLYQLCSVTGPKTLQEMEIEMEMEMKRKMKEKNQDSALKFTDHARGQLNGGFYGSNAKVRNICFFNFMVYICACKHF